MRRSLLAFSIATIVVSFVGALSKAQPGGSGMMGHDMMMGSMARHHQYMMGGIPGPYKTASNPLPFDEKSMRRGAAVYTEDCAACHGATGAGDGPAGKDLNPPPANLAWGPGMQMMRQDPYLYWTVEEGGAPVGSAMPAFKGVLSEPDVWAVVTYVQHGLGSAKCRQHEQCGSNR